jgi:hypothetical protein
MTLEIEEILTIVTVQRLTKTVHTTIYEKGLQLKCKPFSFAIYNTNATLTYNFASKVAC